MDYDKNIWIIGSEKIIRYDGSYFHIYNLIENFCFEFINPSSATIDYEGNIWFGTKNQILKNIKKPKKYQNKPKNTKINQNKPNSKPKKIKINKKKPK